jgi:nondiscriminating glutamyl-tRNA synthetase
MKAIKVRFAPSPTGPLHIGGARSALFNYLFAAHEQGAMVLRIEDTDLERSDRAYEEEIIASLRWLGLSWEEGPGAGGGNGPYRQTERLDIYDQYAKKLLAEDKAYYCFCQPEELEAERQQSGEKGEMIGYSGKCRSLTAEDVAARLAQGIKPTIRFRVPEHKVLVVDDLVRGAVMFETDLLGDYIIVKSDGIPTYNFAVVIDDYLMEITHVIRAEEHLSNTPRQMLIYDALGFELPQFAHISLILGSDKQKMSKRHGATSVLQYRENGYLPEALFNFLSLLGWSPEGENEILPAQEIIQQFSLERVSKSPAVFDVDKLNWLNSQYIKKLSPHELAPLLKPFLQDFPYQEELNRLTAEQYLLLVSAVQERLVSLKDIKEEAAAIFAPLGEDSYEEEARKVLSQPAVIPVLQAFKEQLTAADDVEANKQLIKRIIKENQLKPKEVFMPLRCALSGATHGPELPFLISIWGREETIKRIDHTLEMLETAGEA